MPCVSHRVTSHLLSYLSAFCEHLMTAPTSQRRHRDTQPGPVAPFVPVFRVSIFLGYHPASGFRHLPVLSFCHKKLPPKPYFLLWCFPLVLFLRFCVGFLSVLPHTVPSTRAKRRENPARAHPIASQPFSAYAHATSHCLFLFLNCILLNTFFQFPLHLLIHSLFYLLLSPRLLTTFVQKS
jgi:hypothetical protein